VPCQVCGNPCRTNPTEVQLHQTNAKSGYWLWSSHRLCPPCARAYADFVMHPPRQPVRT
jgi:hypothetical protein